MIDRYGCPWRIIDDDILHLCIVDRDGRPVISFGNQIRWRGTLWAQEIANLIVDSVNSRINIIWKDGQHQYHFAHHRNHGIGCTCGGTARFTNRGESNTPLGHDMIYAIFVCESCKVKTGEISGFRYNSMGEMSIISHVWDGSKFQREEK